MGLGVLGIIGTRPCCAKDIEGVGGQELYEVDCDMVLWYFPQLPLLTDCGIIFFDQ